MNLEDTSLERIAGATGKEFGIINVPQKVEWHEIYELIEQWNSQSDSRVKLIGFDAARTFPFSNDIWAHFEFPVDAIVAYEKSDAAFGKEIVHDPFFAMSAFSVEEGKLIQIEHNKDAEKIILPAGRFAGTKDIALLGFELSKEDFKKRGRDIFLNIADDRIRPVRALKESPKQGDYIPATRDVVFKSHEGSFVGPIVVYRSNYDMSFSFGYTFPHATMPRFHRIAVEIIQVP